MFFRYKGLIYPSYCKSLPASRFIKEFALEYCQGRGINIGYGERIWNFLPSAILLDIKDGDDCNTISSLPQITGRKFDFIFSSHTLEHLDDWRVSLTDWCCCLKTGAILFLYLPHPSMEYWQPQNNKKHKHIMVPQLLEQFVRTLGFDNIQITGKDLYYSFSVIAVKGIDDARI